MRRARPEQAPGPAEQRVCSADGTMIAFERAGQGPALILITGGLTDRTVTRSVAAELAPRFTVYAYDRRGRGSSGDTAPYSAEREVEDLAAVIGAAGGPALVFGHSSGAVLALEAAARGLAITKLAAYEPPYLTGASGRRPADDLAVLGRGPWVRRQDDRPHGSVTDVAWLAGPRTHGALRRRLVRSRHANARRPDGGDPDPGAAAGRRAER
jgi:pimeloyl-ACP methyl ester carboxylesterase